MTQSLAEPSATRAGERIEAWYTQLDPRLGAHLTDPNVVLTLADARGQTEFYVDMPQAEDDAAISDLNSTSRAQGIEFSSEHFQHARTGKDTLLVNVVSHAGIERGSVETRLPGIPKFNSQEDRGGVKSWYQDAADSVKTAAQHGQYPPDLLGQNNYHHLVIGVAKGYPDVAIMASVLEKAPMGNEGVRTKHTHVPYADYYPCAQPGYVYDPKDETEVARHTAKWGKILEEYYQSPQHQVLSSNPDFMRYRT